ncbi:MAG TPA: 4'-phosphopantetheinyl transferase superfamily protein [Solirubrobacteraceae bacterium]|nr:4'-phosphopantetheinyl transferase superfamily protein [Solirubrobacteraceae bacterium]
MAFAGEPVGVDIEQSRLIGNKIRVARRAFGEERVSELARIPPLSRERAFLESWTRREAILKLGAAGGEAWTSPLHVEDLAIGAIAADGPRRLRWRRGDQRSKTLTTGDVPVANG